MSGYTIGEIAIWLLLAAALGFVLGWLVRELVLRARAMPAPAPVEPVETAPAEPVETAPVEPAPVEAAPVEPVESSPVPSTGSGSEPPPVVPGPHPGSALPLADGAAPSDDYVVKVSRSSKIFHAPSSPAYARTAAAIWFTSPEAAEAAGYRRPKNG